MWLIDNSTVVTNNDNIHVQWRVRGTAGHNALAPCIYTQLCFGYTRACLFVAMYMPTNNNQLRCGFTACSMGAARKPQQYNYNSLWL